jgi:integrase
MMTPAEGLTVAEALDQYATDRMAIVIAADRIARATRKLKGHMGDVRAEDRPAVATLVGSYITAQRDAGLSDSTTRRDLIVLRAALRRAWKFGQLPAQPYVAIPPAAPSRKEWLTPEDARKLLEVCQPEVYTFILLALMTGARRGAILDLTWDRVDFKQGTIDFRIPKHPKANRLKHRAIVPMAPVLQCELRRDKARANSEHVVPLKASGLERLLRASTKIANLPGVTAHTLRHTAATWMLGEAKLPLPLVSSMLGHRSSLITETIYAHLSPDHLTPAALSLDALLSLRPSA